MPTDIISNTSPFLYPLGYSDLETAQKAYVNSLISAASQIIEKWLYRTVVQATVTEYIDGDNDESIYLTQRPIASITSVTYISPTTGLDDVVDDVEFHWDSLSGEIQWKPYSTSSSANRWGWPRGFRNIKVIYVAGWLTADVPAPIQKITADLVMGMYDGTLVEGGIEKEKLGDYFYQLKKDNIGSILSSNEKMLGLYRLRK